MKKIYLSIPKPCHEDWNNMTPAEKGRFCSACQKTVVDFTSISDRGLAMFFKKPRVNICGRFNQNQLDHAINIPSKRIPWLKYFFQFTWPAFVLFLKSCGLKDRTVENVITNSKDVRDIARTNPHNIATVGVLMAKIDPADTTVSKSENMDASLKDDIGIIKREKEVSIKTKPGPDTCYVEENCKASIEANADTDTIMISQNKLDTVVVSSNALTGRIHTGAVCTSITVTNTRKKRSVRTETENSFTIYPNPISKGGLLKMSLRIGKGKYLFSLFNVNGQILQRENVAVELDSQVLSLRLTEVASGNYFVQLVNTKSRKTYTEKLIVQ